MTGSTFHYRPEDDFLPVEAIHSLQERLLREQLLYCKTHSPFYRNKLAGFDCERMGLDNLPELPLTSKADLAEEGAERFMAAPAKDFEDIVFSSGTTGNPCMIAYTKHDMERLAYNEHRCFAAAGMTAEDTVLLTCTLDRCFVAGLAYYLGVRSLGAAAIRSGLNTLESHAEIIRRVHPSCLIGVPSFLRHLGHHLKGRKVDASSVKRLICIGEPVRDEQLNSSGLGRQLEELWNAPVHSTYASSEIVSSFCECTERRGGHLLPDLVLAEIVDDAGNVLPPGSAGELVLTQLQCRGMPLIRFRTGDMTFIDDTPCPCGRNSLRIGPILGRKAQMLKCRGTTLYPQTVFSVLDESPEILDYYLVATGENLSDRLEIVAAPKEEGLSMHAVSERLRAKCRLSIPITLKPEEEVRARIFSVSRKPVRFFDLRKGKEKGEGKREDEMPSLSAIKKQEERTEKGRTQE